MKSVSPLSSLHSISHLIKVTNINNSVLTIRLKFSHQDSAIRYLNVKTLIFIKTVLRLVMCYRILYYVRMSVIAQCYTHIHIHTYTHTYIRT